MHDNFSNEELVKLAQDGETSAADLLLRRFKGTVNMLARPYFLMGGDRDDIVQEGMIGLYKAMRDYKAQKSASFATYATQCIKNQIIDAIKSAGRKKHSPLNTYVSFDTDESSSDFLADHLQDPEKIMISRENKSSLENAVKTSLSKLESTILKHFLAGLTYAQIADNLNITQKAVDNALYRIRRKITLEVANEQTK